MVTFCLRTGLRALVVLVVACALAPWGAAGDTAENVTDDAADAAQQRELADGQRLFRAHCAKCHGFAGEGGEGPTLAVLKLPRASTPESLTKVIVEGIPNTSMPGSSLEPPQVQKIVKYLAQVAQLPLEKVSGDARRGAEVYHKKSDCATCHAVAGQGGTLGPDLSKIGQRRGAAHLRESLLEPEKDVPKSFLVFSNDVSLVENYLYVKVVTSDQRTIEGTRVNEDTYSIQIRDADDKLHSFYKRELTEIDKHWGKSPMPSYRDVLGKEEIEDLVAYLVSLKGE